MDERRGGAVLQPAPDMRSERLWRRDGAEWRVAVLRRRDAAAHAVAHPHSAASLSSPLHRASPSLSPAAGMPPTGCSSFSTGHGLATPVVTLRHRRSANTCRLQNANCELGCEMRPRAPLLGKNKQRTP